MFPSLFFNIEQSIILLSDDAEKYIPWTSLLYILQLDIVLLLFDDAIASIPVCVCFHRTHNC